MRKTFQKWLLVFVFAAFAVTFSISYVFQTGQADDHAESLVRLNLEYIKRQISVSQNNLEILKADLKTALIEKTKELSAAVALKPEAFLKDRDFLKRWSKESGLTEINIVDGNGIIVASYPETNVGFDFHDFEETRPYLDLIRAKTDVRVEDIRRSTKTKSHIQFAGVPRRDTRGFVQAGYSSDRYAEALKTEALDRLANNFKIGQTGFVLIVKDGMVVSASSSEMLGKTLQNLGFPAENSLDGDGVFRMSDTDDSLFCVYTHYDGFTLIGVYSESEMYVERNAVLFWSFLFYLILFIVVFFLVSALLEKIVIDGIRHTNQVLSKITAGNLDEKVNVRTNEEFISLSDGINATVNALKRAIVEAAARIDKELDFAREIQKSSLPTAFPPYPDRNEFDVYAVMHPAKEVGGDFYDFFLLGEDSSRLGVVIADVSGKGIPAALFMMSAKTLIKNFAESGMEPAAIFTRANQELCRNNEAGMFVTAFMGILDVRTGRFVYANAGHNPPLFGKNGKTFEFMKLKSGFMLGGLEGVQYVQEEILFENGDALFLYTDGVTEGQNASSELYGDARLREILNGTDGGSPESLLNTVWENVSAFENGTEQSDDLTMLGLRYNVYKTSVPAVLENYEKAWGSVSSYLRENGCPSKVESELGVVFDEIFSNIVRYAYPEREGDIVISCAVGGLRQFATLTFEDAGIPFNPLNKPDPDTTLAPEDREIGNLGIFLVKKIADDVFYEYKDGRNVLTVRKNF